MHQYFFFASPENINETSVTLTDDEFRHAIQVLRKKTGDVIDIVNGRGKLISAVIESISRNQCECRIVSAKTHEKQAVPEITVAFGIVKTKALEIIIRDLTALGITEMVPLLTRHSVKQSINPDRLRKIAVESIKQSGNYYLPSITNAHSFNNWLENLDSNTVKILADQDSDKKMRNLAIKDNSGKNITFLIGPEGGFHDDEISLALSNGFIPVNICPYRLRSELAAVTAVSGVFAHI